MPAVRFSRDRRGYEHTYLVDVSTRGGKSSSRLVYWFRTPPGVKVGREPFDQATRRELEAQNPDLTFDWKAIVSTPIPPPAIDWRSRRHAERAAKASESLSAPSGLAEPEADLEKGPTPLSIEAIENPPAVGPEATRPNPREAADQPAASRRRRRRGGQHRRRPRPNSSAPASGMENRVNEVAPGPGSVVGLQPEGDD